MALIGTELRRSQVTNPRGRTADTAPIALRTNLCANPSGEVDVAGYSSTIPGGGTASNVARSTAAPGALLGTAYPRLSVTANSATVGGGIQYAAASGNGVPVTAGLPYAVGWYVQVSKNQRMRLYADWYTAANALISSSGATAAVITPGSYVRLQLTATAPATAAYVKVRVVAEAGTGGLIWNTGDWVAVDGLLIEQTTRVLGYFDSTYRPFGTATVNGDGSITLYDTVATIRTNLAYDPSTEVTAALTGVWGTGAATPNLTRDTAYALYGSYSLRVNRVTNPGVSICLWDAAADAFAPGDQLTFSAYIWSATARTLTAFGLTTRIDGTADGDVSSGFSSAGGGGTLTLTPNQWTRVFWTTTVPAGGLPATGVSMGVQISDTQTTPFWVDGVLIERGAEVGAFFDGSTPSDGLEAHVWNYAPGATTAAVGYGASRRVAPHSKNASAVLGSDYWTYASGGVGVRGTALRTSAIGSGVSLTSDVLTAGTYTVILQVRAVDAVILTALGDQTAVLAAGATGELRKTVTVGAGSYAATCLQNDAAAKRWVVTGYAVVAGSYTGPYFDGATARTDNASRYVWEGVADNSDTIQEYLPPPTLAITPDDAYRSVQITATGLAATTAISIRRITPGYTAKILRSAEAEPTVGGVLFAYDHEPPLGLTSQYQALSYFTDGSASDWSDPVSVAVGCDYNEVWIKDVGQPLRSMRIIARDLGEREYADRSERHDLVGQELPLTVSDVRAGPTESDTFGTRTQAEDEQLVALVKAGQPLLVQYPPDWGRRDAFYSFGRVREARLRQYGPAEHRNWACDLTEVRDPGGSRTGLPTNSYATVLATFRTYSDLLTQRPTYLSVLAGRSDVQ